MTVTTLDTEIVLQNLGSKWSRKMRHGKKRHKKKMVKKHAAFMQSLKKLGHIFADSIIETMQRRGFSEELFATDEQRLAWDNERHPWWIRTKW